MCLESTSTTGEEGYLYPRTDGNWQRKHAEVTASKAINDSEEKGVA